LAISKAMNSDETSLAHKLLCCYIRLPLDRIWSWWNLILNTILESLMMKQILRTLTPILVLILLMSLMPA